MFLKRLLYTHSLTTMLYINYSYQVHVHD